MLFLRKCCFVEEGPLRFVLFLRKCFFCTGGTLAFHTVFKEILFCRVGTLAFHTVLRKRFVEEGTVFSCVSYSLATDCGVIAT